MSVIFKKIKDAPKNGTYKKTGYDLQKESADFLIKSVYSGTYYLEPQKSKDLLSGRGIKKKQNCTGFYYEVTRRALDKLHTQYNILESF